MRFIKTFVLHLYVDQEAPERLCGELNALPDGKAHSFRNQAELAELLLFGGRMQPSSAQAPQESPTNEGLSDEAIP